MSTTPFSTVSEDDTAVATRMLEAQRRLDWNAVRDCLHPSVVWTLPGTSAVSGTFQGPDEIVRVARIISSAELKVQPLHVMRGFATVTVTIHNTKDLPVPLDEQLALVFRFESGLVRSIDTHLSDVPGLDTFYSALLGTTESSDN